MADNASASEHIDDEALTALIHAAIAVNTSR